MHFLIRAAFVLAAGAAGWALAKRKSMKNEEAAAGETRVYYLDDEESAVQDAVEPVAVAASVLHCFRRMDPITLTGSSDVTFVLADGTKVKLRVTGAGSTHLHEGDTGMLTWSDNQLILFEKNSGELVGGMFYAPAEENKDE